MTECLKEKIEACLLELKRTPTLNEGAVRLLATLGYSSPRTLDLGSVDQFLENNCNSNNLSSSQKDIVDDWKEIDLVFQLTKDEIRDITSLNLNNQAKFDSGRFDSFIFLSLQLKPKNYTRTEFIQATRFANKLFPHIPVIILFRYSDFLTLAVVHRRPNQKNPDRDVLEKVSLIKDICLNKPHPAHIEALSSLELRGLLDANNIKSFDELHSLWEKKLDIEALNQRFYSELFKWFKKAEKECIFPDSKVHQTNTTWQVIRLVTRLLFIWFLKEKKLVPQDLFSENFALNHVKGHCPSSTNYYRSVIQNLFFATLNTPIKERHFFNDFPQQKNFYSYRYSNLLNDPFGFKSYLDQVPFVNGGLFDCLDTDENLVDGFFDELEGDSGELNLPARLLLDQQEGLFRLFENFVFTIEENTPVDVEVALDPELLGLTFENLLASCNEETGETARKETGSFYTPRKVVDYIVREVITEALTGITKPVETEKEHWKDSIEYLLDWEISNEDAKDFFGEKETKILVEAIAGLKILDPAVGSGAFPMAVLQSLTLALRRLDEDNKLWHEYQKKRITHYTNKTFDLENKSEREEELKKFNEFFELYRKSDFGRKLFLIQNCIFGVDIQHIACQIAKLRFFISLIIEQQASSSKENRGIKPLPNLEMRFIAADSLLPIYGKNNTPIQTKNTSEFIERLKLLREEYFSAVDKKSKLEIQQKDGQIRRCLSNELKRPDWDQSAQKISDWNPYDHNSFANWFDKQYMFGVNDNDGFDIVLGNPPYIQLQKNQGSLSNKYNGDKYSSFSRSGDIYQLFIEFGCNILKKDTGVLGYITSNSWLRAKYGKNLRDWLCKHHTLIKLIDLGGGVFHNATVDTAICIIRNGIECQSADKFFQANQVVEITKGQISFPPNQNDFNQFKPQVGSPWLILSSVDSSIINKMKESGKPLKDWDISIYRGIVTGFNEAFIINQSVRDRLVDEDPKSAEILKPVLRGRDIERYHAKWMNLWLIATIPSQKINIDDYSAIKKYLLHYGKERLCQKSLRKNGKLISRKKSPHRWYELQDTCAYHEKFFEDKIIWREIGNRGRFYFDKSGKMILQTAFFITGEQLPYICCFLNSKLTIYFMQKTSTSLGESFRWLKYFVESIPLPRLSLTEMSEFKVLVEEAQKKAAANESNIDNLIEEKILQHYHLSNKEIETIKGTN